MGVHNGHRKRMKEEFLKAGLEHMPPHRVLELLLFYSIPQGDVNGLAHELLGQFGSLTAVLEASYDELLKVPGVGPHTASHLCLLTALARRYYTEKAEKTVFDDPLEKIAQMMVARYVGRTEERLTLVCLDNSLKILYFQFVKVGVEDAVQIQFRDLARIALDCHATQIILGHNHPGGLALPSSADKKTTAELAERFQVLGIRLLDHIVVAGDDYVSMAQSGIFDKAFLGMLRDGGKEQAPEACSREENGV